MINEKHFMRAGMLALAVGVAVVGYRQSRARADGIPMMSPMTYSGTLEEAGALVNGTRNLRLTVWDDAASTDSAHARCTTIAAGTAVTEGRFQVTLDPACTAVVHSTPDLWVEVEVNGGSLGRTKISAVPFAVEAARAADLTPAASHALVPPGTVVAYAGDTAPAGWLICDGSAVSQATYPALFTAIGSAHGSGGATGMFNLPDYRGRFLRGVDGTAGRDPDASGRTAASTGGNTGNTVGSIEGAQFQSHAHGVNDPGHTHSPASAIGFGGNWTYGGNNWALAQNGGTNNFGITASTTGISIQTSGGSETRPINAYVNYIIKY